MNKYHGELHFADVIPDLGVQLGISNLSYLKVAIEQARHYGYEDTANWFESVQKRLQECIKREFYVEDSTTPGDCTGI